LNKGDSIEVIVSKGASKVPVPNVIGLKLTQAEKLLNDNGLLLGNVKYEYNSAPEGTVLSQSLVGGSSDEGQKVSLVVSKGKKKSEEKPSIIEEGSNPSYNPNPVTGSTGGSTWIVEPDTSGSSRGSSSRGSSGSSSGSTSRGSSGSSGESSSGSSSGSGSVIDDSSRTGSVVE
ncbi:MAG: PASTA domain-containing protein, partial [Peptostreptococcus anaerobius]